MIKYPDLLDSPPKSSGTPRLIVPMLFAASFASPTAVISANVFLQSPAAVGPAVCVGHLTQSLNGIDTQAARILNRIDELVNNGDLRDEDEPPPSPTAVAELREMITQAAILTDFGFPHGTVETFFGEINATWKENSRVVRLACFPDRQSLLQIGDTLQPFGSYSSRVSPTPAMLVQAIRELLA